MNMVIIGSFQMVYYYNGAKENVMNIRDILLVLKIM